MGLKRHDTYDINTPTWYPYVAWFTASAGSGKGIERPRFSVN